MVPEQFSERHRDRRFFLQGFGEVRRLADLEPHPQPQPDKHRRQQEWNAPAPCGEIGIAQPQAEQQEQAVRSDEADRRAKLRKHAEARFRSEEHTSELQSLMRISYAVFCLKKKKKTTKTKK